MQEPDYMNLVMLGAIIVFVDLTDQNSYRVSTHYIGA